MNSFLDFQFNYYPLLWMFLRLKNNTKSNNVHERCLGLIYSDKRLSYEEFLGKGSSVSVYPRNIQVPAVQMYKVKNDLLPNIFNELFYQTDMDSYNLRIQHDFEVPFVRTAYHVSESISFLGLKYKILNWQ